MAQYQFNAAAYAPRYSAGDGLPAGKHPVVIVASEFKPTKDSTPSDPRSMLALTLQAIDGPAKGGKQTDRLNLQNPNQQTVNIAMSQLAAYCAVTGRQGFGDTSELHNIPFIVEIGPQKNNDQYMEVKGLFFIDGRDVAAGVAPAPAAAPAPVQYAAPAPQVLDWEALRAPSAAPSAAPQAMGAKPPWAQ